ncbi:hypothetical protein [Alicyclobacillus tolerans]|uniref:DUF5659 domain-containing protein n=1 Tax=Alicyclobacillus tolerans TaxID=90970 RepID=A0A1M6WQ98_9BACL|nr:hypothetical protein [Alicyclobacillus montanus]SHK95695.1 hypothetical protein SAMN05443507_1294 [Alicyclobacillus montanus]
MVYLTATKNEKKAIQTKRYYESQGIPCEIRRNKQTFVLFTVDERYAQQAKQLRLTF